MSGNNIISNNNITQNNNITIINQVSGSKLLEILNQSDLSIVPVSTLYLESLSRNTIVAGGYFVNNQKLVYNKLIGTNTIYELGDFRNLKIDTLYKVMKRINRSLPTMINNKIGSGWSALKNEIKSYFNEKV